MEQLPNEINNIIKDYIIFKPKTNEELEKAVDLWCDDKQEAITKYNNISLWDTSLITDMAELFTLKKISVRILVLIHRNI